jgi:hypothetical protein
MQYEIVRPLGAPRYKEYLGDISITVARICCR